MALSARPWIVLLGWGAALLLTLPLKDTRPDAAAEAYGHAWRLFQHGKLADSQREAEAGRKQFLDSSPGWAEEFRLLEAEAMVWGGSYDEALRLLAAHPSFAKPEENIRQLAIEAVALTHQEQLPAAAARLTRAEGLCKAADYAICGDVIRARGILAVEQGLPGAARDRFVETFSFGEAHHDPWLQATAAANLGRAAIQAGHFDEALDWSRTAYQDAEQLDAEHIAQIAAGNLGWAYLQLGDDERALEQFRNAEKNAEALGSTSSALTWISAAGYVYRDSGDLARATQCYRQAFQLAKKLGSKDDTVDALEDLAQISVDAGKLDEASMYIAQATPMELADGNGLSANVLLTEGMLAAARRQDQQAEKLLREVRENKDNPTTTRLGAGEQLALLYEAEGNTRAAEQMYEATLDEFDSAQAELKSEESQLPFVANAARIYDDYIHLLLAQGKNDEALAVADRSRARTLAQSMGGAAGKTATAKLNPRRIAQKTGATLLFYWLGRKQSCLWAITPEKAAFFPLAAQAEIATRIERYRKAVLNAEDPLELGNQDGRVLYQLLVAPASKLIRRGALVTILADGELNRLNFETLLAPGPSAEHDRGSKPNQDMHYWIDDATVVSAPSLAMLDAANPARAGARNLLLLGNPVSPGEEFPSLPLFAFEMKNIEKHFDAQSVAAFSSGQATPAAYLSSNPARYAYIHFVSHAVSSSTAPLDSAIILSRGGSGADSFKLYARDIMRHSIDARLVTISACFGSGTRSYAGEGLVGLSWAFLRAGAQSVIGSLWEVSDESTPRLMDRLYQGLEAGETPADSLRTAKLALLHSGGRFHTPFYWATFQIYSSR
jgi:CHAT domain-containing protein